MWGSIIGAAGSVLGSLFGSKKQTTTTSIDYDKMVDEATAAGFNPLTALRNGGSAGFTSTVHHPGLSGVGEAIGQIGGALGSALDKRTDPIEQKRDQVESALLDYQLAQFQSGPKPVQSFGNVPTKKGNPLQLQTVPPMSSAADVKNGKAIPNMAFKAGDNPTVSTVGLEDRFGLTSDPKTGDASQWEQRYGEPGDWIGGVYVMGADAIYNAKRKLKELSDGGAGEAQRQYDSAAPFRSWINKEFGTQLGVKKGGRVAPPSTW